MIDMKSWLCGISVENADTQNRQQTRKSFRPGKRTLGSSPGLATNMLVGSDKSLNLLVPMSPYVKPLRLYLMF